MTTATAAAPTLTFVADQECPAPPEAVYELVASPALHPSWAGRDTAKKDGILTLDAREGVAAVGDSWTSTGGLAPDGDVFHDRSVVTEARPAQVFAFTTEARLDRRKKPEWHARFEHRYELVPSGTGTRVHYTCEVRPQNYRPYWLHPVMRPLTRRVMKRIMIDPHLGNLASAAG
jgi:uncharacterized protein YndB with AHSA1/START domain